MLHLLFHGLKKSYFPSCFVCKTQCVFQFSCKCVCLFPVIICIKQYQGEEHNTTALRWTSSGRNALSHPFRSKSLAQQHSEMIHNGNVILCAENIELCRQQGIREMINLKFYRLSVIHSYLYDTSDYKRKLTGSRNTGSLSS